MSNNKEHRQKNNNRSVDNRRHQAGDRYNDQSSLATHQFMGRLGRHGQRNRPPQALPFEVGNGATGYGSLPHRSNDYPPLRFMTQQQQHHHQQQQYYDNSLHVLDPVPPPPPPQSSYGGSYVVSSISRQINHPHQPPTSKSRSTGNNDDNYRDFSLDHPSEAEPLNCVPIISYGPMDQAAPFFSNDRKSHTALGARLSSQPRPKRVQILPFPFMSLTEKSTLRKTASVLDFTEARPGHRRVSSDDIHLRSTLPPFAPSSKSKQRVNQAQLASPKPRHRRADSASSISSVLSEKSVVSDIRKSSLYKEEIGTGVVRMHLPVDSIRLVMDKNLTSGDIYKRITDTCEQEKFLQYHIRSDDNFSSENWQDLLDSHLDDHTACMCQCKNCQKCNHKADGLPPLAYVLAVECDLYRRVLSEISDSKQMPCGMFFCGHHEDVRRPSICIAVFIVVGFFGVCFVLTYFDGY